VRKIRQVTG